MVWRTGWLAIVTALLCSGCGYVGVDLLTDQVDGPDANGASDAAVDSSDGDVAPGSDAMAQRDGRGDASEPRGDGAVPSDGALPAAGDAATDAQVTSCGLGRASCGGDPLACETTLGTTTNCSACGDLCPANGGSAVCSAGSCAVTCNLSGSFAVKVPIALSWPSGFVAAGTGTSNMWALVVATQTGNTSMGTLKPCGFTLPDFFLADGSERYQMRFADSLFDSAAGVPAVSVSFSFANGSTLGAPFTMGNMGVQVGSDLLNAVSDAWPSVGTLMTADVEPDGKPAATGSYSAGLVGGSTYSAVPVNFTRTQRADRGYTAARLVLSASGTVASCNELNGSVSLPRFDTHIVGCRVAGGTTDCSSTQRDLIDNSRPLFAPVGAMPGTMRALRVAPGSSCAAVRAAVP